MKKLGTALLVLALGGGFLLAPGSEAIPNEAAEYNELLMAAVLNQMIPSLPLEEAVILIAEHSTRESVFFLSALSAQRSWILSHNEEEIAVVAKDNLEPYTVTYRYHRKTGAVTMEACRPDSSCVKFLLPGECSEENCGMPCGPIHFSVCIEPPTCCADACADCPGNKCVYHWWESGLCLPGGCIAGWQFLVGYWGDCCSGAE
jgi:hypothetical protein